MTRAVVTGIGHALPAAMDHQQLWDGFFDQHYAGSRVAARVWRGAGIDTRHAAFDPRVRDVSAWSTGERMAAFVPAAMPLGLAAVRDALTDAGVDATEIGLLAVVSCTGYATPGLDILLARELGIAETVQRLHIGHMGCYAALPGLGAVSDFVVARGKPALLLCLELPSLHVQPASSDPEQMVAHALFADAAAALVVTPGPARQEVGGESDGPQLEVVDVAARTDVSEIDAMTWDLTDLGFRMGLSPRVPDVLARHALPMVTDLLTAHGLAPADVAGWAIHPGGRRIVEVVGEQLDLDPKALVPSYDTLREVGNCSSATVLLVLSRLLVDQPPAAGRPVVAMAFGPGLTLYMALLRAG